MSADVLQFDLFKTQAARIASRAMRQERRAILALRREPPRKAAALFSVSARTAASRIPGGAEALEALKRATMFGERGGLSRIAPDVLASVKMLVPGALGACECAGAA